MKFKKTTAPELWQKLDSNAGGWRRYMTFLFLYIFLFHQTDVEDASKLILYWHRPTYFKTHLTQCGGEPVLCAVCELVLHSGTFCVSVDQSKTPRKLVQDLSYSHFSWCYFIITFSQFFQPFKAVKSLRELFSNQQPIYLATGRNTV